MNARHAAVAALIPLALLAPGGCADPAGTEGRTPRKAATPPAGKPGGDGGPAVNQPGPQVDPGNCVNRPARSASIEVSWSSETNRAPLVVWSHNGTSTPATNLHADKMANAKGYHGEWSTLVTVRCGDTLGVTMTGIASQFAAVCTIVDLAGGPVKTGERGCEATYEVP